MYWLFIACGYLAAFMFSILFIPQLIKIIKTKQVRDISFTLIYINIVANISNIIFGLGLYLDGIINASLPILIGCTIAFIWSILLLCFKLYYHVPTQ